MRLVLEAEPAELRARGRQAVGALAVQVEPHAPELAAQLRKAAEVPESGPREMRARPLQESREELGALYRQQMDLMLEEVGQLLDVQVK
jgi:hypothetical protein